MLGNVFIFAGVLYPLVRKLGPGRLPGSIAVECESYRVDIPLGASIPIGAVLPLIVRPTADPRVASTLSAGTWPGRNFSRMG